VYVNSKLSLALSVNIQNQILDPLFSEIEKLSNEKTLLLLAYKRRIDDRERCDKSPQ
jgi:hypothetical protein